MKHTILTIALLASVILATLFLTVSWFPKPAKPYGKVVVDYAAFDGNVLKIGVRSWGTGAPVRIDYIACIYEWGMDEFEVNMTLEFYNTSVISIYLDGVPRYVIIHYIDIWNNEERLVATRVSSMPISIETMKIMKMTRENLLHLPLITIQEIRYF